MNYNDLEKFLSKLNDSTKFEAHLSERGGYITFSNSGKRGGSKFFSLGLDSLIQCFKDIKKNLRDFEKNKEYEEKSWRDLSQYFTDDVASAMLTVQTKPMFSTLSKLTVWANTTELKNIDSDNYIEIEESIIDNTILKLESLADEFSPKTFSKTEITETYDFDLSLFINKLKESNLIFRDNLLIRFELSLLTKKLLILTGLSGSGKTKLAQAFAKWIIEEDKQLKLVPVGADWTNREPLLGYPNALVEGKYVLPESGVLQLILHAEKDPERPYFLILDEMNLSHVERYFADFLSAIESREEISLHSGNSSWNANGYEVPSSLSIPKNLFIIGTVNIDETTYMFSPKVLDRANVIEFRVSQEELAQFLENPADVDLDILSNQGASMAKNFVQIAINKAGAYSQKKSLSKELLKFFNELNKVGAEFGYRSAYEIQRFAALAEQLTENWTFEQIMDAAIAQKLLPKLHGSRKKLIDTLLTLSDLCYTDEKGLSEKLFKDNNNITLEFIKKNAKYPISFEKLMRMHKGLIQNGFTSFAEA